MNKFTMNNVSWDVIEEGEHHFYKIRHEEEGCCLKTIHYAQLEQAQEAVAAITKMIDEPREGYVQLLEVDLKSQTDRHIVCVRFEDVMPLFAMISADPQDIVDLAVKLAKVINGLDEGTDLSAEKFYTDGEAIKYLSLPEVPEEEEGDDEGYEELDMSEDLSLEELSAEFEVADDVPEEEPANYTESRFMSFEDEMTPEVIEDDVEAGLELKITSDFEEHDLNDDIVYETNRELADEFLYNGDFTSALNHLRIAANLRPDDIKTQEDLGYTYLKLSQYKECTYTLKRVISMAPERPKSYINMAIANNRQGVPLKAIAYYEQGLMAMYQHPELTSGAQRQDASESYAYIVSHSSAKRMSKDFQKKLDTAGFKKQRKELQKLIKEQARYE